MGFVGDRLTEGVRAELAGVEEPFDVEYGGQLLLEGNHVEWFVVDVSRFGKDDVAVVGVFVADIVASAIGVEVLGGDGGEGCAHLVRVEARHAEQDPGNGGEGHPDRVENDVFDHSQRRETRTRALSFRGDVDCPCEHTGHTPIVADHLHVVGAQGPAPGQLDGGSSQPVAGACRRGEHHVGVDCHRHRTGRVRCQGEGAVGQREDHASVAPAEEVEMTVFYVEGDDQLVVADRDQLGTKGVGVGIGGEQFGDAPGIEA